MPRRNDPPLPPKEQFKRFVETARSSSSCFSISSHAMAHLAASLSPRCKGSLVASGAEPPNSVVRYDRWNDRWPAGHEQCARSL
jgi:hypothetical protein